MKYSLKRALCLLGILAMIAGMASCTTGGAGDGSDPSGAAGELTDLGGYEFSVVNLWKDSYEFNPQKGENARADAYYDRLQELMKTYNFKLSYKVYSGEDMTADILNAAMSGNKFADYIMLDYARFNSLRTSDLLLPVSRMPYIRLSDPWWSKSVTEVGSFGGENYGLNKESTSLGSVMFFNATLLKENNVVSPYELYRQNKWTWAEFEKLAKQMTIDTTGDSVPDIYGIGTVTWAALQMEIPFLYANGAAEVKPDGDSYRFSMLDTDAQETLTFLKSLYDQKLIYPNMPTTNQGGAAMFKARRVAFMFHQFGFTNYLKDDMKDEYGIVPFPMGPSAKEYCSVDAQYPMYVATTGTKDPEKSSFIFNLCMQPLPETGDETVDDPEYQLRTETLRDDEEALQVYRDLKDKIRPIKGWGIVTLGTLSPAIYSCTRDGKTTPKAAMQTIEDKVQLEIEDFFRKTDKG